MYQRHVICFILVTSIPTFVFLVTEKQKIMGHTTTFSSVDGYCCLYFLIQSNWQVQSDVPHALHPFFLFCYVLMLLLLLLKDFRYVAALLRDDDDGGICNNDK